VTQLAVIRIPGLESVKYCRTWKERRGRGEQSQDAGRGRWSKILKAAIRIQTLAFSC